VQVIIVSPVVDEIPDVDGLELNLDNSLLVIVLNKVPEHWLLAMLALGSVEVTYLEQKFSQCTFCFLIIFFLVKCNFLFFWTTAHGVNLSFHKVFICIFISFSILDLMHNYNI